MEGSHAAAYPRAGGVAAATAPQTVDEGGTGNVSSGGSNSYQVDPATAAYVAQQKQQQQPQAVYDPNTMNAPGDNSVSYQSVGFPTDFSGY